MSANLFSHFLMPVAIAYIMFGIGINLSFADFSTTFKRPKALFTGLVAQIVFLPVVAFIINIFIDIDPIYKVGLVLIAACPGGTTSNIVTLFLKGRLALSVTLTAFNSFLILFTIPFIMKLAIFIYEGAEQEILMPIWSTVGNMLITVLLPTIVGMIVRQYFPVIVLKSEKFINISMTVFLLLVFVGIFVLEDSGSASLASYAYLLIPTFLLNFISMFAGYLLALLLKIRNRGRFTIAIQVGLQNSALAIYVASKLLDQAEIAIVAIIYSSFTLFTTTLWAFIMKKYL
jgi:bile acid:Na+ symporter, BASS family